MTDIIGNMFLFNGKEYLTIDFNSDLHQPAGWKIIYEVIRVEEGIPLFLEDYIERLENSFRLNGIKTIWDTRHIIDTILKLIRINNHRSGPVKLVFGINDHPYLLAYIMQPHLPEPEEYISGVKTVLMNEIRINPNAKVWNNELRNRSVELLKNANAYEAILVNQQGFITEASRSNIFFIKKDEFYTCPDELILPGITRKIVLEILKTSHKKINFKAIRQREISEYESCFLTGTARKIVPVRLIGEQSMSVKNDTLQFVAEMFGNYVKDYIRTNAHKYNY